MSDDCVLTMICMTYLFNCLVVFVFWCFLGFDLFNEQSKVKNIVPMTLITLAVPVVGIIACAIYLWLCSDERKYNADDNSFRRNSQLEEINDWRP